MGPTRTKAVSQTAKKQQNTKATDTRAPSSSNAVNVNEINNNEKQEKPGFFRRVWNWIKGLFTRKKNTETADGGDAAQTFEQTQVQVPENPLPQAETLPAQVTDSGVNNSSEPSPSTDENGEADTTAQGEEVDVPTNVTIGSMTFDITTDENSAMTSTSGTVKLAGKDVQWTSGESISLTQVGGNYAAAGKVNIKSENSAELENVGFTSGENKTSYTKESDTVVKVTDNGILMQINNAELGTLETITGQGITVLNHHVRGIEGDSVFNDATITFDGSKAEIENAESELESWDALPQFIAGNNGMTLQLVRNTSGLEMGVNVKAGKIQIGKSDMAKVVTTQFPDIFFSATDKNSVEFTLPKIAYTR